ncbi:MAG: hypothetical protein A3H44_09825 [Gammaproteobacteria bacterium RIFCSPLOWO2_02_FULL_57_10]|nr:MAG: hypothetical protein A3H44_09825 [Gammaproteobacteria bacterium RIFCSPLOWO2_02_FULL_57_10]
MNTDIPEYCDAIKKNGEPCRQKALYRNWRCKFHGGMSTGPVTDEGKQQSRINGRKGGRPRKTQVLQPQDYLKTEDNQTKPRISKELRLQQARDNDFERKLDELWRTINSLRHTLENRSGKTQVMERQGNGKV